MLIACLAKKGEFFTSAQQDSFAVFEEYAAIVFNAGNLLLLTRVFYKTPNWLKNSFGPEGTRLYCSFKLNICAELLDILEITRLTPSF
jgi:hypothetical protein